MTRTEIINYIFDKYKFNSYLELGVYNPQDNFDKIHAQFKHSVDNMPHPDGPLLYTHWMDTDYFFENFAKEYMYDVIFVDALHEEEQCYRDIKNSLKYLNNNGFIVIHDVNPIQKENTISYLDFLAEKYHGDQWNGTVYRTFIRIKNELKNWSCFAVEEDAGGCGILTQRNILENKIFEFDNTWECFDKNRKEILQLVSFEEYKNIV